MIGLGDVNLTTADFDTGIGAYGVVPRGYGDVTAVNSQAAVGVVRVVGGVHGNRAALTRGGRPGLDALGGRAGGGGDADVAARNGQSFLADNTVVVNDVNRQRTVAAKSFGILAQANSPVFVTGIWSLRGEYRRGLESKYEGNPNSYLGGV